MSLSLYMYIYIYIYISIYTFKTINKHANIYTHTHTRTWTIFSALRNAPAAPFAHTRNTREFKDVGFDDNRFYLILYLDVTQYGVAEV